MAMKRIDSMGLCQLLSKVVNVTKYPFQLDERESAADKKASIFGKLDSTRK